MKNSNPIGVFDSGYGGLTVLKGIVQELPEYDYIYLGDNARAPYGTRSFETVYEYTLECVSRLFELGCPLVILACNTASAKALRNIQQKDLKRIAPGKRVLGVIRPTAEVVGTLSKSGHIGVLGTPGTISSNSYPIEIAKFAPGLTVHQEACPIWVPLVENNEYETEGAGFFIRKHIDALLGRDPRIDTIVLGCTHYPLLIPQISAHLPGGIKLVSQAEIVADSLKDYLERHPEISSQCTKESSLTFFTTDDAANFDKAASIFFGQQVSSQHLQL